VRICFGITFWDEDRDREVEVECEMIDVPMDLVENYTETKFKTWLEKKRIEWSKRQEASVRKELENLIKENRELATEILKASVKKGKK
jgi:hypothetical protein